MSKQKSMPLSIRFTEDQIATIAEYQSRFGFNASQAVRYLMSMGEYYLNNCQACFVPPEHCSAHVLNNKEVLTDE